MIPLAAFIEGHDLAPVIAAGLCFMIPIVAILTKHQQKMARILRGQENGQVPLPLPNQDAIRAEIQDLRNTVNQQALMLDTIANSQREILSRLDNANELPDRLNQR